MRYLLTLLLSYPQTSLLEPVFPLAGLVREAARVRRGLTRLCRTSLYRLSLLLHARWTERDGGATQWLCYAIDIYLALSIDANNMYPPIPRGRCVVLQYNDSPVLQSEQQSEVCLCVYVSVCVSGYLCVYVCTSK